MSTRPNTPALGPLGQKVFVGNNIGFREMRPQRSRLAAEALAEAAPLRPKSSIPNKPLRSSVAAVCPSLISPEPQRAARGRREVEGPAWMLGEPLANLWMRMDQMPARDRAAAIHLQIISSSSRRRHRRSSPWPASARPW